MSRHSIELTVNGSHGAVQVDADRRLIDVIRDDLDLTGTKEGCGIGVCGLCAVIVDGELLSSCLILAVTVSGASVETIEGMAAADGSPTALQEAFIRRGGFQCGICTPGHLMAAHALLTERANPSADEIREWMMGNLCRCTGYEGILRAIASVADRGGAT